MDANTIIALVVIFAATTLYLFPKLNATFFRKLTQLLAWTFKTKVARFLLRKIFAKRIEREQRRREELNRLLDSMAYTVDNAKARRILGLACKDYCLTDIKKAYRDRARKAHPDLGGSDEKMADVNWAYKQLTKGDV